LFLFTFDKRVVHRGAGLQPVQQGGMHGVQLVTAIIPFATTSAMPLFERHIVSIPRAQVASSDVILARFVNE
jgi:hypothetical protein